MRVDKDIQALTEAYAKVFLKEEQVGPDHREAEELSNIQGESDTACKNLANAVCQGLLSNNPSISDKNTVVENNVITVTDYNGKNFTITVEHTR
jgi:hypothetical protein